MRSSAKTVPVSGPPPGQVVPLDLPANYILDGKLRVRRRIGTGGVGSVFEADDLETGERVAVKVIHAAFAQVPEVLERFRREAESLAAVNSPYVVGIRGVGTAMTPEGALPYLAMELVHGCTVADLLERGIPLSVPEALWLTVQALDALESIHARGVLHRDIKPENLFLARQPDGTSRIKLIDFGLSRELRETTPDRLTRVGFTVGTPMYMAPEQALGEITADHRIDLFSLGVTLYEMLTGVLPFDGPTYTVVLARVLQATPKSPRSLRPDLSPTLEAIVMRALEKDPTRRYSSAAAFRRAVENYERTQDFPMEEEACRLAS